MLHFSSNGFIISQAWAAVRGKLRDLRLCAFATDTRWELTAPGERRLDELSVLALLLFSELAFSGLAMLSLREEDLSRLFVAMAAGGCWWLFSQRGWRGWFEQAGAASAPNEGREGSFCTDGFRLNLRGVFSGDCGALKDSNELILCFIDDPPGDTRDKLDCSFLLETLSWLGGF